MKSNSDAYTYHEHDTSFLYYLCRSYKKNSRSYKYFRITDTKYHGSAGILTFTEVRRLVNIHNSVTVCYNSYDSFKTK